MTAADRLRLAGEQLHGSRWQSALARDLNVSDRRVRQWLAGETIPPGVWLEIERLLTVSKGWPRDEWLIASDAEGLREYIIHTCAPRFIARMAHDGDDADTLTGATYACQSGEILCEIVWMDPIPVDEPSLRELFARAETAIDIYTSDSEEATSGA